MPYYRPLVIGNVARDLAHLDPVTIRTPSRKLGRDIATWCRFTTHAFSRSPALGEVPHLLDEGRRPRVFCPDRYRLSFHLPGAMALLADPGRHVWETASERNWLHRAEVEVVEGGARTNYQVFFAVKKAGRREPFDVEMTVESAYAFDPRRPPKLRGRTVIAGLLTATVEGRKLRTQAPGKH